MHVMAGTRAALLANTKPRLVQGPRTWDTTISESTIVNHNRFARPPASSELRRLSWSVKEQKPLIRQLFPVCSPSCSQQICKVQLGAFARK